MTKVAAGMAGGMAPLWRVTEAAASVAPVDSGRKQRMTVRALALAAAALLLPASPAAAQPTAPASRLQVDQRYFTLPNGLKVVLSRDTAVPIVTVAVYYGIGFRVEPRERTGFAHLFEHLMFQGSANAPKGVFDDTISYAGGVSNGSTRFDFTNYYEIAPSGTLDRLLWLDADRMARPVITDEVLKNQQGVVGNEVKVNVLNQPYSTWPWIDLPMLANTNWYNSHNFYGDLKEIEAATVADANAFQKQFYVPNNAVLVVVGDIDYDATRRTVEQLFGPIPRGPAVTLPDLTEPRQTAPRTKTRTDALAPKPGYAAGYHMPPRGSADWYAMGLLDQVLLQGDDSRLRRKLVNETGITGDLSGGINADLGSMFNYRGPMLWAFNFTHDPDKSDGQITAAIDQVIDDTRQRPVSQEELDRARTKLRSGLYAGIDSQGHLGLVDPARLLCAVRQRPGRGEPDRGRLRQGGARRPAARRARLSAPRQPLDLHDRARRKGRREVSRRLFVAALLGLTAPALAQSFPPAPPIAPPSLSRSPRRRPIRSQRPDRQPHSMGRGAQDLRRARHLRREPERGRADLGRGPDRRDAEGGRGRPFVRRPRPRRRLAGRQSVDGQR